MYFFKSLFPKSIWDTLVHCTLIGMTKKKIDSLVI